jgi:DNA-binding winged helix-turn-helix (wHTH) protein
MTALIGGRDPRRDQGVREGSHANGTFWLDTVNEYLWRAGVPIDLTPKAFAVLRYLVEHPGRLVTQQELLDALWPDVYVQPEIVKTYIRDIRRILGDQPKAARFIETRPRRGYTFVAAVTEENGSVPAAAGSPSRRTSAGAPSPLPATGASPREDTGTQHHPDAGNETPSSLWDGHRNGVGRRSARHPSYLVVSRDGPQRGTAESIPGTSPRRPLDTRAGVRGSSSRDASRRPNGGGAGEADTLATTWAEARGVGQESLS